MYDLFPSCLLNQVTNIDDFTRIFVIDHLFGQADTRQAIFARERSDENSSYRAWMIDHGFLFGGAEWRIRDMPKHGLHFDKAVYRGADFDTLSEEVISKLHTLCADELRSATDEVAVIWLTDSERTELDQLLQAIPARIKTAHEIISFHKNALESIFGKTKRVAKINSVPDAYHAGELRAASALV